MRTCSHVKGVHKRELCEECLYEEKRDREVTGNMPVVYLAGPFRGENSWEMEQNIRRAEELALEVWKKGMAVICPHTNTRFYQGAAPDEVWLTGDLAIVKKCDAVLMTPDWVRSEGAREERMWALRWGIPVFENLLDLVVWNGDSANLCGVWEDCE